MKIVTIKIRENDRVFFVVDGKYWLLRPKKKIIKVHEGNITLYKARLLWDKLIENDYELIESSSFDELRIEKIPITAKTRKLKARWSIEAQQDLEQDFFGTIINEITDNN